jgi:hypothetical protein
MIWSFATVCVDSYSARTRLSEGVGTFRMLQNDKTKNAEGDASAI